MQKRFLISKIFIVLYHKNEEQYYNIFPQKNWILKTGKRIDSVESNRFQMC